jgi:hypothetical protein
MSSKSFEGNFFDEDSFRPLTLSYTFSPALLLAAISLNASGAFYIKRAKRPCYGTFSLILSYTSSSFFFLLRKDGQDYLSQFIKKNR